MERSCEFDISVRVQHWGEPEEVAAAAKTAIEGALNYRFNRSYVSAVVDVSVQRRRQRERLPDDPVCPDISGADI